MSRLMSVAMTTDAVIQRRKTVTRRKGWWLDKNGRRLLKPGYHLTLCRKVQGRKPGEPIERLAEVEVLDMRREPLGLLSSDWRDRSDLPYHESWDEWAWREVSREGFPGMQPDEFIGKLFIDAQGLSLDEKITRIEWRYVCGSGFCECGGCVL